jgi:K+-sensing histidine kinase KdpD
MTHADIAATEHRAPMLGTTTSATLHYLAALVLVVFASAIAVGVDSRIAIPNVSLVYVVPVVIAGTAFGVGPSLFAATLGALSYNYFLTEPRYTLTVDDPANIWAIALLFIVGLIVGGVAFVSRRTANEATELRRKAVALQRFSADVTAADGINAVTALTADALGALFAAPAVVMTVRNGRLEIAARTGEPELSAAEREAAESCLSAQTPLRGGVYPHDGSRFDFWPVRLGDRSVAVIGVALPDERPALPDQPVDVVLSLLAMAMARA